MWLHQGVRLSLERRNAHHAAFLQCDQRSLMSADKEKGDVTIARRCKTIVSRGNYSRRLVAASDQCGNTCVAPSLPVVLQKSGVQAR